MRLTICWDTNPVFIHLLIHKVSVEGPPYTQYQAVQEDISASETNKPYGICVHLLIVTT